jgi:hypothetical protein
MSETMQMRSFRTFRTAATVALALATVVPLVSAEAQRLVRRNPGTSLTWGSTGFSSMQGAITNAFGGTANIVAVASIANFADLAGSTALFLDLGASGAGGALSAQEQVTLAQYIASGRRVFFLGENNAWAGWNNSFLSLVGGTASPTLVTGPVTATGTHPITSGVTTVTITGGIAATGGTALFTPAVGALWGGAQNVFSFLDYNAFNNTNWGLTDNARFGGNVAQWLAGTQVGVVPEPSTYALLATGLVVLGVARRRARAG